MFDNTSIAVVECPKCNAKFEFPDVNEQTHDTLVKHALGKHDFYCRECKFSGDHFRITLKHYDGSLGGYVGHGRDA